MALNLPSVPHFCLSSPHFTVCLVSSFRYNGLATLALAAFGRVRALRTCCGPFGPAITLKRAVSYTHLTLPTILRV